MDFLGLDKKVEDENVPIEHLDYGYVEKCTDANELHSILRVLKSGREGRYFELEKFVEQRMMDAMSPEDRSKYIALTVDPSRDEVRTAASDVADFVSQVKADDAELASSGSVSNIVRPPRSATTATLSANATPKPVTDASQSAPQRVDWKQGDMASYYEKWGSFNPDEVSAAWLVQVQHAGTDCILCRIHQAVEELLRSSKSCRLMSVQRQKLAGRQLCGN